MFAIIDCNNFYASCERLFRPDLREKPIIVLSNNDGCVIARSNEAKALGIQMGQPFFQIQQTCEKNHVHVFSSNYTLYGDLSARVMQTIEATWPHIEIYSIDEAFLDFSTLSNEQHIPFAQRLRQLIGQHIGIPVSIGVGPTKTLAKAANRLAKKQKNSPVFTLMPEDPCLALIAVEDIWGIGRQWSKKLNAMYIRTAAELAKQSPQWIRQQFGLPLMQTTLELQGFQCHDLNPPQSRKSIIASKSFGKCQTELSVLAQAISHHCRRATEKLRQQQGKVLRMSVFIRTNPFQTQRPQYANHCQIQFPSGTDDIRVITQYARHALQHIFKKGYHYHKVGVGLDDIVYHEQVPLLETHFPENAEGLMQVMEAIQHKFGRHCIHLAAEGTQTHTWQMKSEQRSPKYTTEWRDLPIVKIT
jgi:DNA polymerase V